MPVPITQPQDAAPLRVEADDALAAPRGVMVTAEELALLRASVAFHVQCITDPALRVRLEKAAQKLGLLAAMQAA